MADIVWKAHSPLQSRLVPGRFGASLAQPGIRLTDIRAFSLVQIMARRGQWDATTRAAKTCFGIEAPDRPKAVVGRKALLLWSGPDQFLALASQAGEAGSFETLRQAFAGAASLSDQSDARAFIRITGSRVRDVLAKLSSLDLSDTAFSIGWAAATLIDHTSVNLWRTDDTPAELPVFGILVLTSFAESLWQTFLDAAAEYGVDIGRTEGIPPVL